MAANLVRLFTESSPPLGWTNATGQISASLPSPSDIRNGNFTSDGWSSSGQRRNSLARQSISLSRVGTNATVRRQSLVAGLSALNPEITAEVDEVGLVSTEEDADIVSPSKKLEGHKAATTAEHPVLPDRTASGSPLDPLDPLSSLDPGATTNAAAEPAHVPHDPRQPYPNGYQFPPKHSAGQSIRIGLKAFGKFILTPFGFIVTIYGLNVVGWGGMLFLVLIGGAPTMCHPNCSDKNSKAQIWLEIDSQILNALFCVTGLGLIPWRFRDLYYLLQYRWQKKESGIRRLAGIHNDWFRLNESQGIPIEWDPKLEGPLPEGIPETAFALPVNKSPPPPLTGERAPASKYWRLDFMIWAYVINTLLQICLCGVMWGFTRFTRPGWTTGLLISLACIVAMGGGFMGFRESKAVKKIEGVPVSDEDLEILHQMQDAEKRGIFPQEENRVVA